MPWVCERDRHGPKLTEQWDDIFGGVDNRRSTAFWRKVAAEVGPSRKARAHDFLSRTRVLWRQQGFHGGDD